MSRKTITKFSAFVIFLLLVGLAFTGCFSASSGQKRQQDNSTGKISTDYSAPKVVGQIESGEIRESSGLVVSRCQPGVLWTHNDSGDKNFIYAFNAKGEKLGTWKVANAENDDWEDMAAFRNAQGECFLYIADTGNNERLRNEFTIYRIREPRVSGDGKSSGRKNPLATENAETIRFQYPDMRHDAETLMVHPLSGDIYLLSKRLSGAAGVYKLAAAAYAPGKINTLEKITDFGVPAIPNGLLTGGDISPDGRRAIICDYFSAYEIVLPEGAKGFDEIWKQRPIIVQLGERQQGEAVAYSADGNAVFATSEKKNSPLIELRRK